MGLTSDVYLKTKVLIYQV